MQEGGGGQAPPGSEFNPIAVSADKAFIILKWLLKLALRGSKGGRHSVEHEIEARMLRDAVQSIEPGQWFYFSTEPNVIYLQGPDRRPTLFKNTREGQELHHIHYPDSPPVAHRAPFGGGRAKV
jgi:hypothetical protein